LLGSKTILNDGGQERVAWLCAERIIADLPIHLEVLPEIPAIGQFLKGEDTFGEQKWSQIPNQEHVEIQIKATEFVNSQIAEEVVPLNPKPERPIIRSIFRKMLR
jgi:hypothetical protein